MKKMADIMEDLGFNPNGSDEVKKAFIKNLIKQAQVAEQQRPPQTPEQVIKEDNKAEKFEQISLFDQKKIG